MKGNGVDVSSEATVRSFSFGMMSPCRTQAMCVKTNFLQGHLTLTGDFYLPEWGKKSGKIHLRWKTWAWEVLGNSYPVQTEYSLGSVCLDIRNFSKGKL